MYLLRNLSEITNKLIYNNINDQRDIKLGKIIEEELDAILKDQKR